MISHQHKAIFVHIPKCAGQSIEHMFLEDLGLSWEERAPLLLRTNKDSDLGPPRLAHLLARDYVRLGHIAQEIFDNYFKFAVIRDPYDRAVSTYNYLNISIPKVFRSNSVFINRVSKRIFGQKLISFDEFITDFLPEVFFLGDERGEKSKFWFVRQQSDYIFDVAGASLIDRLIRFEALSAEVEDIRGCCGLQSDLKHVNKTKAETKTKIKTQNLSSKHLDTIEELYKEDFELLGYNRRPR